MDPDSLAPASSAFAAAAGSPLENPVIRCGHSRNEPWSAWAVAAGVGVLPRGLVIAGDLHYREPVPSLLKLALRLLLHSGGQDAVPPPGHQPSEAPQLVFPADYVVGDSRAMAELHEQVRSLARGDIPVLIVGETGVGKEHIARILHASSPRRDGPFVAVNCAAVPPELLEAELFGIERGVATGVAARPGKFQLAEGGVLLLDEIGDMSRDLQAKLLRALQEMEVHPLGARVPVPIDVRVIAATNTDLEQRMLEGKFRRDLFYRVAGIALRVPPLRERRADIPPLVERSLSLYADEIGKPIRGITVKALQALGAAPWPGNVRELEHEVRRLVYLCPAGTAIDSSMLSEAVLHPATPLQSEALGPNGELDLDRRVADLERQLITVALARTRGNRSKAAKLLGISRNGLALKIERLGLPER
jgi:transcriptional regulator with PAS, ATPase and Fis domain